MVLTMLSCQTINKAITKVRTDETYTTIGVHGGTDSDHTILPNHRNDDSQIYIGGIGIQYGKHHSERLRYGIEGLATYHTYNSDKIGQQKFTSITSSIFLEYSVIKKEKWSFYLRSGIGGGFAPTYDEKYKVVGDSRILGEGDFGFGYERKMKNGKSWKIEFREIHFSAKGADPGENTGLLLWILEF